MRAGGFELGSRLCFSRSVGKKSQVDYMQRVGFNRRFIIKTYEKAKLRGLHPI